MGCCCGNRKKQTREFPVQKWEYINLQDFKATGCGEPFAYGYVWFSLFLSVAVYSVDSFTAVQLLAFNRWSSSIKPAISFDVSRWIFAICIILSFINLGFEAIRALRVIKRNNVAECYMDPLAVRWQSVRVGKGQGWRRFLVFAALTKGKKGAEYIALFTYFGFKSWIRVLVCSGPRQVINAFTLRSVYVAKLSTDAKSVDGAFLGFFDKLKLLAEEDYRQAAILSGMAFTFVVWAFALLYLILSVLFYVFFLFHWIPRADGGLTGYCERKINQALRPIVTKRINKALAKAAQTSGEKSQPERVAKVPDFATFSDDKLPGMPMLSRLDTGQSLPPYASRSSSPGGIELSNLKGAGLDRTTTNGSNSSLTATVPLVSAAADMGHGPPSPSVYSSRSGTAMSQRTQMTGLAPSQGPGATMPQGPGAAMPQRGQSPGILPARPGTSNQYGYGNVPPPRPGMHRALSPMPFTDSTSVSTNPMAFYSNPSSPPERQGASSVPPRAQMPPSGPKQYRPYSPYAAQSAQAMNNPYNRVLSPELQRGPIQPPLRSATAGPMPPSGPRYPVQRSATGPMPNRAATFETHQQQSRWQQNMPFAPPQRSNTGEEFFDGRWVPPSQRNKPESYDVESSYM